jgi:hypothetical protein
VAGMGVTVRRVSVSMVVGDDGVGLQALAKKSKVEIIKTVTNFWSIF